MTNRNQLLQPRAGHRASHQRQGNSIHSISTSRMAYRRSTQRARNEQLADSILEIGQRMKNQELNFATPRTWLQQRSQQRTLDFGHLTLRRPRRLAPGFWLLAPDSRPPLSCYSVPMNPISDALAAEIARRLEL